MIDEMIVGLIAALLQKLSLAQMQAPKRVALKRHR